MFIIYYTVSKHTVLLNICIIKYLKINLYNMIKLILKLIKTK